MLWWLEKRSFFLKRQACPPSFAACISLRVATAKLVHSYLTVRSVFIFAHQGPWLSRELDEFISSIVCESFGWARLSYSASCLGLRPRVYWKPALARIYTAPFSACPSRTGAWTVASDPKSLLPFPSFLDLASHRVDWWMIQYLHMLVVECWPYLARSAANYPILAPHIRTKQHLLAKKVFFWKSAVVHYSHLSCFQPPYLPGFAV